MTEIEFSKPPESLSYIDTKDLLINSQHVYQSIHSYLNPDIIVGYEALMRFPSKARTDTVVASILNSSPDDLTTASIRHLVRDLPSIPPDNFITFNLAPEQIISTNFNNLMDNLASKTVDHSRIVLEITEGQKGKFYNHQEIYNRVFDVVIRHSFTIAIDDFPTGISRSLVPYLKGFNKPMLKMDGSYLIDTILLKDMDMLTHFLSYGSIIFERISSESTLKQVQSLAKNNNFDTSNICLQGYLFGKPESLVSRINITATNQLHP